MNLLKYLTENEVFLHLESTAKKKVIEELLDKLITAKRFKKDRKKELLSLLLAREKMGSTAIGHGIALPHIRIEGIKDIVLALGVSDAGVDFDALDSAPVHIVFLIISSQKEAGLHLKVLAHVAQLIKDKYFVSNLKEAPDAKTILKVIHKQQKFIV